PGPSGGSSCRAVRTTRPAERAVPPSFRNQALGVPTDVGAEELTCGVGVFDPSSSPGCAEDAVATRRPATFRPPKSRSWPSKWPPKSRERSDGSSAPFVLYRDGLSLGRTMERDLEAMIAVKGSSCRPGR